MTEWKTKRAQSKIKLHPVRRAYVDGDAIKTVPFEWSYASTMPWNSPDWAWVSRINYDNCVVLDSVPQWIDINTDPFE